MKNDIYNTNEKIDDVNNSIKHISNSIDELSPSHRRLNDILDNIVIKLNQFPEQ